MASCNIRRTTCAWREAPVFREILANCDFKSIGADPDLLPDLAERIAVSYQKGDTGLGGG